MRNNHSSWMGDLLAKNSPYATKPINSIMIPGTHDSGTFGMGMSTRTQSLSIGEQLSMGIRYFDCRVRIHDDTYYFYHTIGSNNDLGKKSDDPSKGTPQTYALKQMRDFLKNNPKEVIILKFQDFSDFGHDDYWDLVKLLRAYLEFDVTGPKPSKCQLVRLTEGTAQYIDQESLKSLTDAGKRVFVFFDRRNVPTDQETATNIWNYCFQYEPLLAKGNFGLWDPYWGDDKNLSVNDTDMAHMKIWWDWHKTNITTWASTGFYVLQSHMQELHPTGNGADCIYYNIAEQVADGNYYMNQHKSNGDFYSNNHRNIQHYISWFKGGTPVNIITFDYAQHGNVCDAIVDFYNNTQPTHGPINYRQNIYLKLNALNRYVGPLKTSSGYNYPTVDENAAVLRIFLSANFASNNQIKDGDTVYITTTESAAGNNNNLSVYKTNELYYYNAQTDHEQWVIRNGSNGGGINDGDHVWFENVSYSGQFLTLDGCYLTTRKMDQPTRWVVVGK